MAKGWSFGALTSALKSAAFVDTGVAEGNVVVVGQKNFGLAFSQVMASLNMNTYQFVTGETRYVLWSNVTNAPAGLGFASTAYIRIWCTNTAGATQNLMMYDGGEVMYAVQLNVTVNPATSNVVLVPLANVAGRRMNLAGAVGQFDMGADAAGGFSTFFMRKDANQAGYIQTSHASKEMYLSGGGTGRVTVRSDGGANFANGINVSSSLSNMWGVKADAIHVNTSPLTRIPGNTQGMFLGWNENGDGRGTVIVNKGGGAGGLKFRFVNSGNTAEDGNVIFEGSGNIRSSASIIAAANVYAGGGSNGFLAPDGNVYGTAWGGYLNNQLNDKINAVRLTNVRAVSGTNGGNMGALVCGIGDFGANDGYGAVCDLQVYKNNAGWVQIGIG